MPIKLTLNLLYCLTVIFTSNFCYSQFSTHEEISYSYNSYNGGTGAVSSGDLDEDGDEDIIWHDGMGGTDGLYYIENFGDLNMGNPKLISSFSNFSGQITVVDVDGDGHLDIVIGSFNTGTLGWFKNLTNFNFSTLNIITNQVPNLWSFEMLDIDADGDSDFIIKDLWSNSVVLAQNMGAGNFASLISIIPNTTAILIKSGDIDNDGDIDIVLATEGVGDSIFYVQNLGGLNFGPKQILANKDSVTCLSLGDLDGDGLLDVIFSAKDDAMYSVLNLGSNNFGAPTIVNPNNPLVDYFGMIDYDNDGDLDVLTNETNIGTNKCVLFNNGFGNFSSPVKQPDFDGSTQYYFKDLDNDGLTDYIVDAGYVGWFSIVKNKGQGQFSNDQLITKMAGYKVKSVDVDDDGHKDLVISETNLPYLLWIKNFPNSENQFGRQRVIPNSYGCSITDFLDVDGDGLKDLVTSIPPILSSTYNIIWNKNLGNGDFDTLRVLLNAVNAEEIVVNDLDNDGYDDIIFREVSTVKWLKNLNGQGSFSSPITISAGEEIKIVDYNNDGYKDVLTNGYLSINQGNNIFVQNNFGGNSPNFLRDKNADGLLDLVIFEYSNFYNEYGFEVNLNNGTGFLSTNWFFIPIPIVPIIPSGNTWEAIPTNLNDDNLEDFVFARDSGTSQTELVFILGVDDTTYTPAQSFFTSGYNSSYKSLTVFDVDMDGDDDLFISMQGIYRIDNHFLNKIQLKGRLFVDLNGNGINDSTDFGCKKIGIQSIPQSDYTFTFSNGNYIFNLSDSAGAYTISPSIPQYWVISTDSLAYHVSIDSSFFQLDSLDFGIVPDTLIYEAESSLTGAFPRCNTVVNYWLNYKNLGTLPLDGVVKLTLADSLTYISSIVTPDSIIGNEIFWSITNLNVFADSLIPMLVKMPDFNSLGDTLFSKVEISVLDSNSNILTFTDSLSQILVCAYDPNDKTVAPAGVGTIGEIPFETTELDYTIRFQNTGNDTALVVKILDQISPNLDFQSLQFVAASHPVEIEVAQNGKITFIFNDINLPDSTVNELESHGFVRFKLNLKPNLTPGTKIFNTGYIYFDANPAIVTNTVQNTLSCSFYSADFNFVGDTTFCDSDAPITFTNAIPMGGLYSGNAVVGNQFDPQNSTEDTILVYYTYTNSYSCILIDSIELINVSGPYASINYSDTNMFCINAPNVMLNQATPSGGVLNGLGISSQTFDPSIAGVGSHIITYAVTNSAGCLSVDSLIFIVDGCLGMQELNLLGVSVFPNPYEDEIVLKSDYPLPDRYEIVLTDVIGNKLFSQFSSDKHEVKLRIPSNSSEMTILTVFDANSGEKIFVTRLIRLK